jgi:tRNA uridine 5-carbamoylmethylation protein Kti12
MTSLWTEAYRPNSLDGYVFADLSQKQTIERWIETKNLPHLLFTGSPGVGKTTLSKILINLLEIDQYDVLEINASRENGVDTIRDKITNFVQTMPFGDIKVVLLDECLDGDTLITVLDGNEEKLIPIKNADSVNTLVKSYNIEEQRNEWKQFLLFDKGERETLEIEFENGDVVICTPDHKWYVDDGGTTKVVRADELCEFGHVLTT